MRTFKFIFAVCIGMMLTAFQFSASAEISHKSGDVIIGSGTMSSQDGSVIIGTSVCSRKKIYVAAETTGGTTVYGTVIATYIPTGGTQATATNSPSRLAIFPKNSGIDNNTATFRRDDNNSAPATWNVTITVSGSMQAESTVYVEVYYNTADD
jgi:hypothetical protein